jgi:hypothetical protein
MGAPPFFTTRSDGVPHPHPEIRSFLPARFEMAAGGLEEVALAEN